MESGLASSDPQSDLFAPYWVNFIFSALFNTLQAKYKILQGDCRSQMGALEKLQVIVSEILQCEKSYEISLRRIGMHKHDIMAQGNAMNMQKVNGEGKSSS